MLPRCKPPRLPPRQMAGGAGLSAPQNESVLAFLRHAYDKGLGPECFSAEEILTRR